MIKVVGKISELSGVSSPLLPCFYSVFDFGTNGDGVWVQTSGKEISAYIANSGGNVFVSACETADFSELESFVEYSGCASITSDVYLPFKRTFSERVLMVLDSVCASCCDAGFLTCTDRAETYFDIASVFFTDTDRIKDFYTDISRKILKNSASVSYLQAEGRTVSAAAAPYVYGSCAAICGVQTKEEYRGKSFACSCVRSLCAHLKCNGVENVVLWCEEQLVPFYEKCGFKPCGKIFVTE